MSTANAPQPGHPSTPRGCLLQSCSPDPRHVGFSPFSCLFSTLLCLLLVPCLPPRMHGHWYLICKHLYCSHSREKEGDVVTGAGFMGCLQPKGSFSS